MAVVKIIKVIHKLLKLGNSRASCTHSFIHTRLTSYDVCPYIWNRSTLKYKMDKITALVEPTFWPTSLVIPQETGVI